MRTIDQVIVGHHGGGGGGAGGVYDPNTGRIQAHVALGTPADLDRAIFAPLPDGEAWMPAHPSPRP